MSKDNGRSASGKLRRAGEGMRTDNSATNPLDFYPTPEWATQALCDRIQTDGSCLEPAAGGGHMTAVLEEYFDYVVERDIYDHENRGIQVADFVTGQPFGEFDWIITNPPFKLFASFAERALRQANQGVAMLARLTVLEGSRRYERLWRDTPPSRVLIFSERVTMTAGEITNLNNSATCYAWLVWDKVGDYTSAPALEWIPPGTRKPTPGAGMAHNRGGAPLPLATHPQLFSPLIHPAADNPSSSETEAE